MAEGAAFGAYVRVSSAFLVSTPASPGILVILVVVHLSCALFLHFLSFLVWLFASSSRLGTGSSESETVYGGYSFEEMDLEEGCTPLCVHLLGSCALSGRQALPRVKGDGDLLVKVRKETGACLTGSQAQVHGGCARVRISMAPETQPTWPLRWFSGAQRTAGSHWCHSDEPLFGRRNDGGGYRRPHLPHDSAPYNLPDLGVAPGMAGVSSDSNRRSVSAAARSSSWKGVLERVGIWAGGEPRRVPLLTMILSFVS